MTPLVLLGCGYIGTALARAALTRERPVYALVRTPERAEALRRMGVRISVASDIAGRAWHKAIPAGGVDVVFSVSSGGDSVAFGARTSTAWPRRSHGRRKARLGNFLYTSSTGVYSQSQEVAVDEISPVGGDTRSDTLVETENLLLAAARRKGSGVARGFVLRLGGLYGPERHYMLDTLRHGGATFAGRGDFRINYLHRDDAVDAIVCALNTPAGRPGGVYNITDGRPARKDEIAAWLAERLGCPTPAFDVHATTGRAARRGSGSPDRIVSNAKALAELGWKPAYPDFRAGYAAILKGES